MLNRIRHELRWLLRRRPRDRAAVFSRSNISIDRDIACDGGLVCLYVKAWFEPGRKFGLRLYGDDYINIYAYILPDTGDVRVTYVIHYTDGLIDAERPYMALTKDERKLIRVMADEVSLEESGMTVRQCWREAA